MEVIEGDRGSFAASNGQNNDILELEELKIENPAINRPRPA